MRRATLLAGLALLLACPPPGAEVPDAGGPVPDDPRLGVRLTDALVTRPWFVAVGATEAATWVGVALERGFDEELRLAPAEVRVFRLPWGATSAQVLPPPPFVARVAFGVMAGAEGAVLYGADNGQARFAFTDGHAWTELPALPLPGTQVQAVVARGPGQVLVRTVQGFTMLRDGGWTPFDAEPSARVGPWGDGGFQLVSARGRELCTTWYDEATLAPLGAPTCAPSPVDAPQPGEAQNGTPARFQVLYTDDAGASGVALVENGWPTFTPDVPGDWLDPSVGAERVLVRVASGEARTVMQAGLLEAGQGAGLAFPMMAPTLRCDDCDGGPSPTRAQVAAVVPSPDATRAAVLVVADVDAQSRFLVRHVGLPWREVPFESWCEGGCGASLVCVQPGHAPWAPRCEASPW